MRILATIGALAIVAGIGNILFGGFIMSRRPPNPPSSPGR
jgi:hypothetical protein